MSKTTVSVSRNKLNVEVNVNVSAVRITISTDFCIDFVFKFSGRRDKSCSIIRGGPGRFMLLGLDGFLLGCFGIACGFGSFRIRDCHGFWPFLVFSLWPPASFFIVIFSMESICPHFTSTMVISSLFWIICGEV